MFCLKLNGRDLLVMIKLILYLDIGLFILKNKKGQSISLTFTLDNFFFFFNFKNSLKNNQLQDILHEIHFFF